MPLASPHSSASRSETFNVWNPLVCKKLCGGNRFRFRCFGRTEYTEREPAGCHIGAQNDSRASLSAPICDSSALLDHSLAQSSALLDRALAQRLSFPRLSPGPAAGWGSRPGWDIPGDTRRTSAHPRLASERAVFCTPGKPGFPAILARSCQKINAGDAEAQRKNQPRPRCEKNEPASDLRKMNSPPIYLKFTRPILSDKPFLFVALKPLFMLPCALCVDRSVAFRFQFQERTGLP